MTGKGHSSEAKETTKAEPKQEQAAETQPVPLLLQRAYADPSTLTPNNVKQLQRTVGNRATVRLISRTLPIQAKLTLGAVNDPYEQEADQVAEQVVRKLDSPPVQRKDDEEDLAMKPFSAVQRHAEDEALQTKTVHPTISKIQREWTQPRPSFVIRREVEDGKTIQGKYAHGPEGGEIDPGVTSQIQAARGGGRPLDDGIRGSMESGFGADFSSVRVHTGTQADTLNRSLNARAFTVGSDIFFKRGEYSPGSNGGKKLLAHELTHTVQQGAAQRKVALQRHPEHAEEEEVLPKRIQRHPNHAEEQEVQPKRTRRTLQRHPEHAEEEEVLPKRIQRHPNHVEEQAQGQTVQPKRMRLALQRHPGHAKEEEVQAQRQPLSTTFHTLTPVYQAQIQRLIVDKGDDKQPANRSVSDVMSKLKTDYKFIDSKALKGRLQEWHKAGKSFETWGDLDEQLRGEGFPLKHQAKKLQLEAKYGIPIGGASGIEQFGEEMLDTLDGLFSHLPPSHLSAMKGIMRQKEDTASFYDPNTQTLTISYAQPAWLYTWGKKNTKLFGKDARALMENAATPVMMTGSGYSQSKDQALGLDSNQRSTISYSRDDAFADTRIVEWTVLHEIGHAVDERIQWTKRNGSDPKFGGWKTHGEQKEEAAQEEVAEAYLQAAGLSLDALDRIQISKDDEINKAIAGLTKVRDHYQGLITKGDQVEFYEGKKKEKEQQIAEQQAMLGTTISGKEIFMKAFLGTDLASKNKAAAEIVKGLAKQDERPAMQQKLEGVLKKIALAQAVPWQFPDGLASQLEVNGRVYQLDHYKTWVSYLAAARARILSPYQFSSPGEWIAEAYAAFYGTNNSAKALLSDDTKAKILEELGAPPQKKTPEKDRQKGAFETVVAGKPVLSGPPEEEEVALLDVQVQEKEYSEAEFDQDYSVIVGGYSEPSPLSLAVSQNDEFDNSD